MREAISEGYKAAMKARLEAANSSGEHTWAEMKSQREHGKQVLDAF